MISVTMGTPSSSDTSCIILIPSTPRPWKEYGEVLGLNAPPRNMADPFLAPPLATSLNCSSLSTAHGPAAITTSLEPMGTPPTSTTVLSLFHERVERTGAPSPFTDMAFCGALISSPHVRNTVFPYREMRLKL